MGYHWHLRPLMAERGMFATTDLVPLLAERGVELSREQVYRLVTRVPERLVADDAGRVVRHPVAARPAELIEPYRATRPRPTARGDAARHRAAPADAGPGCCPAPRH